MNSDLGAYTLPTTRSMNWRNCIAGGVALVLGLVIVVLQVIDGFWDNSGTIKPLKALFGGLAFIGIGAWYLIRGAKAESWRNDEILLTQESQNKTKRLNVNIIIADPASLPSFQNECEKVEKEMREKAAVMERNFESERKDKI